MPGCIEDPEERQAVALLDLEPWAGGARLNLVGIEPFEMTGRVIVQRQSRSSHRAEQSQNATTREERGSMMKALVYKGPGSKAWEDVPNPTIQADTDAIVRVDCTTICGSDLHILKGDVPEVTEGRILGHEAVGTVESVGVGGHDGRARRSGARLVHQRLWAMPLLPGRPLRSVPRWRGVDPGPPHRRDAGRVRPGALRRHLDLQGARGKRATRRS